MNQLSTRERELVAIGAAIGSNCASCIDYHVPQARAAGLTDSQITEAVELADAIRQVSARNALTAASDALARPATEDQQSAPAGPCQALSQHARGCC